MRSTKASPKKAASKHTQGSFSERFGKNSTAKKSTTRAAAADKKPTKKVASKHTQTASLERFKSKAGGKNAKAEARGERAGADKKKGAPKAAKMMGMKKGSSRSR